MRDWGTSDGLRETLRAAGVAVYDKEKLWKARDGRHGTIRPHTSASSSGASYGGGAGATGQGSDSKSGCVGGAANVGQGGGGGGAGRIRINSFEPCDCGGVVSPVASEGSMFIE